MHIHIPYELKLKGLKQRFLFYEIIRGEFPHSIYYRVLHKLLKSSLLRYGTLQHFLLWGKHIPEGGASSRSGGALPLTPSQRSRICAFTSRNRRSLDGKSGTVRLATFADVRSRVWRQRKDRPMMRCQALAGRLFITMHSSAMLLHMRPLSPASSTPRIIFCRRNAFLRRPTPSPSSRWFAHSTAAGMTAPTASLTARCALHTRTAALHRPTNAGTSPTGATEAAASGSTPTGRHSTPPPHSLLRHLVPLRADGEGPAATLLRHAFLARDSIFIPAFLASLSNAPQVDDPSPNASDPLLPLLPLVGPPHQRLHAGFPLTQRVLLAEALQLLLEGDAPQRVVRDAFEQAELACRRALLDLEEIRDEFFYLPPPAFSPAHGAAEADGAYGRLLHRQYAAERAGWLAVQTCPLFRLWMFELRAAAAYYGTLFSIPGSGGTPSTHVASVTVYSIVAADVRRDALLSETLLRWEADAVKAASEREERRATERRRDQLSMWRRLRRRMTQQNAALGEEEDKFAYWLRLKTGEIRGTETHRPHAQRGEETEGSAAEGGVHRKQIPSMAEERAAHCPAGGAAVPPAPPSLVYEYGRSMLRSCGRAGSSTVYTSLTDLFVHELLALERDCFGAFRFDPRGDNRHLLHLFQLKDVGKTWESFALLLHPLLRQSGNYVVSYRPIANARWWEFCVRCGQEDHRLIPNTPIPVPVTEGGRDPPQPHSAQGTTQGDEAAPAPEALPLFEEIRVSTSPENAASPLQSSSMVRFMAYYNDPICHLRPGATEKEKRGNLQHTEVFELAVESPRDDEDMRWISLNRWFRKRV
eukprot:gene1455-844_t